MSFPLSVSDLSLWLAVMAIILLLTSELLFYSTSYLMNIILDRNRMRLITLGLGTGFMITVVMRIFQRL